MQDSGEDDDSDSSDNDETENGDDEDVPSHSDVSADEEENNGIFIFGFEAMTLNMCDLRSMVYFFLFPSPLVFSLLSKRSYFLEN